jgi:hypothetical protein
MAEDSDERPSPQEAPAGQGDDQSPFPPPQLEEIGKSLDPPGLERRSDG